MNKAILLTIILLPILSNAQTVSVAINQKTKAIKDSVISWRRHLHEYPELSNRETKTSAFVVEHLNALGLDVKSGDC